MICAGRGILSGGEKMKQPIYGNGIRSDFTQALAENAVARAKFESLPPREREEILRRAGQRRGLQEQKALLDELTGWQIGHPPYQL